MSNKNIIDVLSHKNNIILNIYKLGTNSLCIGREHVWIVNYTRPGLSRMIFLNQSSVEMVKFKSVTRNRSKDEIFETEYQALRHKKNHGLNQSKYFAWVGERCGNNHPSPPLRLKIYNRTLKLGNCLPQMDLQIHILHAPYSTFLNFQKLCIISAYT